MSDLIIIIGLISQLNGLLNSIPNALWWKLWINNICWGWSEVKIFIFKSFYLYFFAKQNVEQEDETKAQEKNNLHINEFKALSKFIYE